MKKRIISIALTVALISVLLLTSTVSAATEFWRGTVNDVVADSLVVTLSTDNIPLINSQYSWDAGTVGTPMLVGQIKTLILRVRNNPGGQPATIVPTINGVSGEYLTTYVRANWSTYSPITLVATYPTGANSYNDYTLTVEARAPTTSPVSFFIGFSRQ